jgi:hypothetical protein
MAAAVRWLESHHHDHELSGGGLAVLSACFPAGDTLGQLKRLSVVRAVRLLSARGTSSDTLWQWARFRDVSEATLLTARIPSSVNTPQVSPLGSSDTTAAPACP